MRSWDDIFLGATRYRKTQWHAPAMDPSRGCGWRVSSLNEIVFLGDGATPLVAWNSLYPGHLGYARAAPPTPASPCPKTVK